MEMDLFMESDSDCDESSASTVEEPMEVDAHPPAEDSSHENALSEEKEKIFIDVQSEPNRKLDHRNGQNEFIGALTDDHKIVFGVAVLGMRSYNMRLKSGPSFTNKCFLLDKRAYLNSEVYHYANPQRLGHITLLEVSADVYIPSLNKIILKVPVTADNYVYSVNSSYWRSSPHVILKNKRGRVGDAVYTLILQDKDGRRFKFLASTGNSHNKITRIREHRAFSCPIVAGDKVKIATISAEHPPEWLGEDGVFTTLEEYLVESIVLDKIGVRWDSSPKPHYQHRFNSLLSAIHNSAFEDDEESKSDTKAFVEQLLAQKKSLLEQAQQSHQSMMNFLKLDHTNPSNSKMFPNENITLDLNDKDPTNEKNSTHGKAPESPEMTEEKFWKTLESAYQKTDETSPSFPQIKPILIDGLGAVDINPVIPMDILDKPSSSKTADYPTDSPIIKRRCHESHFSPTVDWMEASELLPHSLLPTRREVVVGSRLKLIGQYVAITPEAYYNTMISEFERLTSTNIAPLDEKESAKLVSFEEPVYGDVTLRHSSVTVEWFDGAVQSGINSTELQKVKKLSHPTEPHVYRNMLLQKEKKAATIRSYKKDKYHDNRTTDFGLVTRVSQEKMLTVKWFKRVPDEKGPFMLYDEEIMPQYDNIKHNLYRIPLDAHVYFPGEHRDPDNIYDCVARVMSMNDDGTQTVQYLDNSETTFWPGEAHPVDAFSSGDFDFDGYDMDGSFDDLGEFYDEDQPPITDFFDFDSLPSVSFLDTDAYSSNAAAAPLGFSTDNSGLFDIQSLHSASLTLSSNFLSTPPAPIPPSVSAHFSAAAQSSGKIAVSLSPSGSSPPTPTYEPQSIHGLRRGRCYTQVTLETKFIDYLRRIGDGYNTSRGINYLAAIFLVLDAEQRSIPWSETKLSVYLRNCKNAFTEVGELKDAFYFIQNHFSRSNADDSTKALLLERYPEFEERLNALFKVNETGVPSVVKHIYDLYKTFATSPVTIQTRPAFLNDRDQSIVVVFPVQPSKDVKDWLDKTIREPPMNKNYYTKHKIVFSYICKEQFYNFKVPDGKGVYVCYVCDETRTPILSLQSNTVFMGSTFKNLANEYYKIFGEESQSIFAGTLRNVNMFNDTRVACEHLMSNTPLNNINPPENDEFELIGKNILRADECLWKDSYHAYYAKFDKAKKEDEIRKDKADRMDFDLEALTHSLNFDMDDAFDPPQHENTFPALFFKGELFPDLATPRAIVIQVSPNLNPSGLTESFLVFHILHQIAESPVWPDLTIKIHRDCGNMSTLSSNFVVAWIILRRKHLLSSPYFNLIEVQNMAEHLKDECFKASGEYVDRYGLETTRQLRNILYKMSSLSCINLWAKINVIQKFFGINRILDAIKGIITGGQCDVIPFKDLPKLTEECTDVELREQLASIQLNMVPRPYFASYAVHGTFKTVEVVTSHSFISNPAREMRRDFVATVKKEHKLLRDNISEGIHVVAFADRLDLLRAIIIGPVDTPYQGVPFLFDIYLGPNYPQEPPRVKYVSLTSVAINPNLYTEGTVCLSLLGTWKGENQTMRWCPGTSNLLQVVCSIQVEILMEACPYFNEPGFEMRRSSEEGLTAAKQYNGQVLVGSAEYFGEIMASPPVEFEDLLRSHSRTVLEYAHRLRCMLEGMEDPSFPIDLNDAVRHVVRRHLDRLDEVVGAMHATAPAETAPASEMAKLKEFFNVDANAVLTMFSSGNPGSECDGLNSYILLCHS